MAPVFSRAFSTASTEEIKKSIHKKRKDESKMKIHKEHKKQFEKELNDIEFILLDYHRRKEYDNYFFIYFFPQDILKNKSMNRSYFNDEITTDIPYLEHFENTTPSSFFESDIIPSSYQESNIDNPSHSQIIFSQNSSFIQSGTDGTMVYRKDYRNINGKEEKKEEKYFIDQNGNKRQLLL